MSFFSNLNFASTVVSFGCISFAASNFGIKFGRAISFSNPSGYKLVSKSDHAEELYKAIAKDAETDDNAPDWAKKEATLRRWCKRNEEKARKWKETSKYCLIKNNVKHQLIDQGYTIKPENQSTTTNSSNGNSGSNQTTTTNNECTKEVFESYADSTGNSVGFLFALSKCVEPKEGTTTTQPAHSQGTGVARS